MTEITAALPQEIDLVMYEGDTWTQDFQLNQDGTPLSFTGVTFESWARPEHSTAAAIQLTVTPGTNGHVVVAAPAGGLPYGIYEWDLELTKAAVVTTWIHGRLTIRRSVSP